MTLPAAEFVPDTSSREIAPGSLSMHSVSPVLIDVRKPAGFARRVAGEIVIFLRLSGWKIDPHTAVAEVSDPVFPHWPRRVVVHCRPTGLPLIQC